MNSYSNIGFSPKTANIKGNYRSTHRNISPMKSDVFFGAHKPYNMAKARTFHDVPADANIFLFSSKSKVNLPEGRSAKECIVTDKGFGFWAKFFGGEEANTMFLKRNEVDYAHGDLTGKRNTCALILTDNSKVNQIDNVSKVKLTNNSEVNLISSVDTLQINDSTVDEVNVQGTVTLNGNSNLNKVKSYSVTAYPGDKIGSIKANYLNSKPDLSQPRDYLHVDDADINMAAEVNQAKIKNLKTSDLIINNSLADNITATYGLQFNNSAIKNFNVGRLKKMTGCKIDNFNILGVSTRLKMYDKIQINTLTLNDHDAKLFVFPREEWGQATDNYIKKINIQGYSKVPNRPNLKIQGDIDIETIEFKEGPGVVELTKPENPEKPIKVINGFIKYNVPEEEVPTIDDVDV